MEAALTAGILCFNVESAAELDALNAVAGRARPARAGVASASTPTSTRAPIRTSRPASRRASSASPSTRRRRSTARARDAAARRGPRHRLPHRLADHRPAAVPRGRGQGVRPRRSARGPTASRSSTSTWAAASASATATRTPMPLPDTRAMLREPSRARRERLLLRAGRGSWSATPACCSRASSTSSRAASADFAIVDAAMNDLIRPALYDAWHAVDAGAPARRRGAPLADRRTGLRERRLPRPRPRARARAGRPARRARRRRLRLRDELQLQLAPARLRGDGRRRSRASRAPRETRRTNFSRANRCCRNRIARARASRSRAHDRATCSRVRNRNSRVCNAPESAKKSCNSTKCG